MRSGYVGVGLFAALVCCVSVACGADGEAEPETDVRAEDAAVADSTVADAAADATVAVDATDDVAAADVAPDAELDVSTDTEADVAPDVELDVSTDTEADVAPDVAPDAAPDAEVDAEVDVAPDAAPDAEGDATPDVVECDDLACAPGSRCVEGECSAACGVTLACADGYVCVAGECTEVPTCSCEDSDGDGFYSVECDDPLCVPRTDCDDTTDAVSPSVVEVCGNAIDDDCSDGDAPCPTVCGSGNGLYCGTNGVPGDPSILYVCVDGRVDFRSFCVEGCQFNEPGFNDACNPGTCPFGSGLYCGPIVGLPDNVLLNCVAGAYVFAEACENRCVVADPGFNDFCE